MAENVLHFAAVRIRLTGFGSLRMQLKSLDEANAVELYPLTMSNTSGIEPTRVTNFVTQRARYKIYTTDIDENFKINRVILYARQLWSAYPGTS